MMSMASGLRLGRCCKRKRNDDGLKRKKNAAKAEELRLRQRLLELDKKTPPNTKINTGDVIDISSFLFTKHRDYLIKYTSNPNQKVWANQLAGKVIILYFMNLFPSTDCWMLETTCLVDIYNHIQPKGGLEVVFVPLLDDAAAASSNPPDSTAEELSFKEIFSVMPWAAIPLWDIESRRNLQKRFGDISTLRSVPPFSFVIDPAGVVLQCWADCHFVTYGSAGYPFSLEKINLLRSEDHRARKNPSITTLLTSPERNYVISNRGDKVPVSDLENKVVGLYFYESKTSLYFYESETDDFTPKLLMAYKELAKYENFEIVLIYVNDTVDTHDYVTEVSFWETFRTMPWLALPFKDPNCKKLMRIVDYPVELGAMEPDPTFVIIGPHGKYMERYGKDILLKFGNAAYPFTCESAAKLEVERVKRLKLEMIWTNPNTLFRQKDGPNVLFSQLLGKRIILLMENDWLRERKDFYRMLQARYLQVKGTNDEFEVVQICNKRGADMPWLRTDPLAKESNERKLLFSAFHFGRGLLAFDSDGRLVRRSIYPKFKIEDTDFPFQSGSLETDAVIVELETSYRWRRD